MRRLVQGNEAIFLGAIKAGASFFAGYPISPSSEILVLAAEQAARDTTFKFIQSEDELAAANAVIGASLAGAKSFTATSGPGFTLMQEAIGYAHQVEVPAVFIDVQRVGPATGMPTMPSQQDIVQTHYGSSGDYYPIVFYPNSVEECYRYAVAAFNAAEESLSPVILLSDAFVGHLNEAVDLDTVEVDLTVLCNDNQVYGLTGGQLGPTTPRGTPTVSSPAGAPYDPINLQNLMKSGAKYFYARTTVYHQVHLRNCIKEAIAWSGFAFVDIMSQCIENHGRRLGFNSAYEMLLHFRKTLLANLDYEVSLLYDYDSAVRGTMSVAYLIFDKEPIANPVIQEADILLKLSDKAEGLRAEKIVCETGLCTDEEIPFGKLGMEKFGREVFGNMIALGHLMALVGIEVSEEELVKVLPLKYKEENISAVQFGYNLKEEDLERGLKSRKRREFDFPSEQPGAVDLDAESRG